MTATSSNAPTASRPQNDAWTAHPVALLVAAVLLSVAASLLVSGIGDADETATSRESAAAQDASQPAPVAEPEQGADVLPSLVAKSELPATSTDEVNVAVAPQMPPPIARTTPALVEVSFEVVENVSAIDPARGVEHETWGYRLVDAPTDGLVVGTPGPVIRARVGDVLRFTITNPERNRNPHNIDFHAVTGQGGGAEATTVAPGETRTIEARLLYPGFFMYHCAYGDVPAHIARGMVGGILVEPEAPLPEVAQEWYVVQSEYYLDDADADADAGARDLDRTALTDESPSHVVFNGAVGAIAGDNALEMQVGERARIYFVNAGLNLASNLHPIGSHWDAVYPEAALLGAPLRGSQTTLVPAGGGTVVELVGQVPQTVVLVDHALSRAFDKGALGHITVSGEEDPELFEEMEPGDVERPAPPPDPAENEAADDQSSTAPYEVSILAGSGEFQDLDAPDEFDPHEQPADYSVNVLEVKVGDTVTWTNDDAMMHTVTSADGGFDSGLLAAGDTWSHTFTEPGEYEYLCTPHPWMRATVVVTA